MEKIIDGYWDGEPMWHYKTAEDTLLELLAEESEKRKKQNYQGSITE